MTRCKSPFEEMEIRRRLSINLKEIREARGMSIGALAEAARLTEGDIVNLEKRTIDIWDISPTALEALAGALGCQRTDLLRQVPAILVPAEWKRAERTTH